MGKPGVRLVDEDNFYPEKYSTNCKRCSDVVKKVCPAPAFSGLPCDICIDANVECEWKPVLPRGLSRNVTASKVILQAWRTGVAIPKQTRGSQQKGKHQEDDSDEDDFSPPPAKRSNTSKRGKLDAEFLPLPELRELGAGRHRPEATAGPSRLDRGREEEPKSKTFDFFDGDKFARPSKRSRPDDVPPKRPEREREVQRNAQNRRDSSGSSDLSEPSPSQEVRATKTPRKEIRDEPSSSKRRSSPPSASLPKARELDRTVSGTSTTHTPVPLKKKRVVQSDSEDDYQEPEPSKKRVDDEDKDVRKEKKPRLSFGEGDDTPRKNPRGEDGRPKPKQRRDLAEREVARTDRGGDVESKKVRRDEVVDVDKMDRGERELPKKVRRDERDETTRVRRDERDESERRPRDERDRERDGDRPKKDKWDDRDDHKKIKRDDRDDESVDPARKKRRLSDDAKPVNEPSQQKNKQHSAIAQRALDPKRAKPDTPTQGGEPSPVARKPARGFGSTSGKSTPAGKNSGSSGDKVMDLLSASLAGASPAYASSLGVQSSCRRDRYSTRMDRTPAKPIAPVVQVTRGTLNLMGTIKSISDFQTAAKRRYAHSYGLQPVGTAKSTQTTAFMNRFREQRARGAYHNSLANLLTIPDTSLPPKEAKPLSEVQQWLQVHGTAPLAPLKTSAPVVRITPAESIEPASTEPVQGEPSEPMTNSPIVL
ncbi:hypothetical protein FFLO_01824 [Filobasidium floriforme]|uniref:Uncharacterized protein n=1 Tax=Filobasidium floriforme TaxID=5210 RepID=A0A8K0JNY6_9TREE|nr:hypothetical protein FFLO_01824 [Filobasidium floriforme]